MPPHLLTVARLFVAQASLLVEEPEQAVLERLISGESMHEVARRLWPSRPTIGRWWQWLREGFDAHSLHLRSRFPELGRAVDWEAFWTRCFDQMSLGEAMGWLDRMEVRVP